MHSLQPWPLGRPLLLLHALLQLVHINRQQMMLAVIATKQQVDVHLCCVHPTAASIPFPCSPLLHLSLSPSFHALLQVAR